MSVGQLNAQSREELETERMRIIEQIDNTSKVLNKTSKNKKATLDELRLIQLQIKNREKVISNIRQTLQLSASQIEEGSKQKDKLNQRYRQLRKDYFSLIQMTYRKKLSENNLVYVLSSGTWVESLQRIRYSKMIESHLRTQMESMDLTAQEIELAVEAIKKERDSQEKLLREEEDSFAQLEKDENKKDDILFQLEGDEKRLKGALIKQRQEREDLNKAIERVILSTFKAQAGKERTHPGKESTSGAFSQNRGKIDWPVPGGSVLSKYGKQKHPSLKNVFIQNNGIDILAFDNAPVLCVFDGEVVGITQVPGNDYMVIVKHGNFYSVYSKIQEILVSRGDLLEAGKEIGKLGRNNAQLHFEIWKDKQKVDPEIWLK